MKISELLEAKEKPVDDRSVDPAARVKRIIKSLLDGKSVKFTVGQTVSQPKKNGDAIVNIEVRNQSRNYDLSNLVDDDDDEVSKAIRDKVALRRKVVDLEGQKRDFMVTLFKRVKAELGGFSEIGFNQDPTTNKYIYVAPGLFDPEKQIKNWSGNVRFKFAFSSDVHTLKFDMEEESRRVVPLLAKLIKDDPAFKKIDMDPGRSGKISFNIPDEYIKAFIASYPDDKKVNGKWRNWENTADDEAREKFGAEEWPKLGKKIKQLFTQIKTPLRLMVSGGKHGWIFVSFGKPKASDLEK